MAQLGTKQHPAIVRVASQEQAEAILARCRNNGWQVIVGIEPDKPEDLSDFERLLHPAVPARSDGKTGRNEPCPCGSGKKYKRCCG